MKISKKTKTWYESDDGFKFMFEPVEDTVRVTRTDTGYTIKYLTIDSDFETPDQWDDDCFLVHYHRSFQVTDDRIEKDDLVDYVRGKTEITDYWVFIVAALIHSGVWLSLADSFAADPGGWDTSHCGAVLIPKNEHWTTKEQAQAAAQGLIETWNQALSGDVYGCVVEHYDHEKMQINHDSCWGYYGKEYAMESLENDI